MSRYTAKQKSDEAKREVSMRRRVYPRRVAQGAMEQSDADRQIAIMEEIASDYAVQAAPDLPGLEAQR